MGWQMSLDGSTWQLKEVTMAGYSMRMVPEKPGSGVRAGAGGGGESLASRKSMRLKRSMRGRMREDGAGGEQQREA